MVKFIGQQKLLNESQEHPFLGDPDFALGSLSYSCKSEIWEGNVVKPQVLSFICHVTLGQ